MEQANQPFLHRIVKVKAGCCNGSGTFAYGRHHGGDQRGNSAFLPSLCLLQQLVIHLLRHGYFPPWINAIVLILPFNAAFVNKILPCTLNNPFLKRGICRTVAAPCSYLPLRTPIVGRSPPMETVSELFGKSDTLGNTAQF
jgi:hypothetical protein